MRKITVRVLALRTCAHSQARMHTPAQPGLWVEVAEEIVLIDEGGAEHCHSILFSRISRFFPSSHLIRSVI